MWLVWKLLFSTNSLAKLLSDSLLLDSLLSDSLLLDSLLSDSLLLDSLVSDSLLSDRLLSDSLLLDSLLLDRLLSDSLLLDSLLSDRWAYHIQNCSLISERHKTIYASFVSLLFKSSFSFMTWHAIFMINWLIIKFVNKQIGNKQLNN